MARKSRKINIAESIVIAKDVVANIFKAGAYIRLSVDDGDIDTVRTQERLVTQYIKEHPELQLEEIYIDNGYSGTNFDRPEFNRLMEDVKKGKIQCVVVKDLSRFGRNAVETGYYLETIFPKLNVRFIAITDDFDNSRSEDMDNIAVPVKNMINEFYAKDSSKKILASVDARKSRGVYKLSRPLFGYVLGEDRKHFELDEEMAPYVKMVFQWLLLDVPKKEIADRLNLLRIPSPLQRLMEGKVRVDEKDTKWLGDTIQNMLKNPCYSGDLVLGRMKQELYKGKKRYMTNQDDWLVIEDAHPPMLARDDYEELQEEFKAASEKSKKQRKKYVADKMKFQNKFMGMVYCAECGGLMRYYRYTHDYDTNIKVGSYYVCNFPTATKLCKDHKVEENYLKIIVMDQIQILIQTICDKKKLLEKMKNENTEKSIFYKTGVKIRTLERNISQLEQSNTKLYEDYIEGIVEKEDFQLMKEKTIQKLFDMRELLQKEKSGLRMLQKKYDSYMDMINSVKPYLGKREFNEELIKELVERIDVTADGDIHIRFACQDGFRLFDEMIEGGTNEVSEWTVL